MSEVDTTLVLACLEYKVSNNIETPEEHKLYLDLKQYGHVALNDLDNYNTYELLKEEVAEG